MHPSELTDDILLALILGELPDQDAARVRAAADTSPRWRDRLAVLTRAASDLRSYASMEAQMSTSEVQRARLTALMSGRSASWLSDAAARTREVVATIVTHTLRAPTLGFRGGASEAVGGLIRAEADGVSFDFRVVADPASGGHMLVQGQVECAAGAEAPRALTAVHTRTGVASSCTLEPDGYFEVRLAPGPYRWELATGGALIVIESVTMGASEPGTTA